MGNGRLSLGCVLWTELIWSRAWPTT